MEAKGNERRARLWSCETYTGGEEGSKEGGMEWKGRQTINIINKDSHGLPITTKSGLYTLFHQIDCRDISFLLLHA